MSRRTLDKQNLTPSELKLKVFNYRFTTVKKPLMWSKGAGILMP